MDYLDFEELGTAALDALTELGAAPDLDLGILMDETPINKTRTTHTPSRRRRRVESTYLLKLSGPLTLQTVAQAAHLPSLPPVYQGESECGTTDFCCISQASLDAVEEWLRKTQKAYKCTKIPNNIAHKDRTPPTLGVDPTMPHNRPDNSTSTSPPTSYPVWYFFYGTLAEPDRLNRLFMGLQSDTVAYQEPDLLPATVLHGTIRKWGQYKALVDSPNSTVDGSAFLVESAEQEDALRRYEGDNYESVACTMFVGENTIQGYTFRYAGYEDALS